MNLKDLEIYNERGSLYYIVSYIYLIEGTAGLIFTAFLIRSSFRLMLKSKSPHLKICFGILITDFLFSLIIIITGAAANINGEYLPTSNWLCGLQDILYTGGTYISIWYVALMSLERGLLIIHKTQLPIWFWLGVMIFEVAWFLIANIISISLNQMGLAELAIYCMSTPDYPLGYFTLTVYFVMMVLCLLTVIYSYIGIAIIQRRRAWNDIRDLNMDKDETLKQANKVIAKVLLLLALFLACNLTEIINDTMEVVSGETRSAAADFASIIMLNFNPLSNCIILIQFHDPIKVALFETYPFLARLLSKNDAQNTEIRTV